MREDFFDEMKSKMIWNKYFPKVKFAVFFNFIAACILYIVLVVSTPALSKWLHKSHPHYLGIVFPVLVVITLANVITVLRGKENTRMDTVLRLSFLGTFLSVVIFLIFRSEVGWHSSLYEITASWDMGIEMVISIFCSLGVFWGYKGIGDIVIKHEEDKDETV